MRQSLTLAPLVSILALSSTPGIAQEKQPEQRASGGTALRDDGQAFTTGWNIDHAAGCSAGANNGVPYMVLISQEGNAQWLSVAPQAMMIMAAACQTGNIVAFNVVNATGFWDLIFSVPGK